MWLVVQAGDLHGSLRALQQSLELSSRLEEASGDVDVLGAIGDVYTDLGNLEKAAEVLGCSLLCGMRCMVIGWHACMHAC